MNCETIHFSPAVGGEVRELRQAKLIPVERDGGGPVRRGDGEPELADAALAGSVHAVHDTILAAPPRRCHGPAGSGRGSTGAATSD